MPTQARYSYEYTILSLNFCCTSVIGTLNAGGRRMMGFTLLCEAIRQQRQVNFIYKAARWRLEPYIIGYNVSGDTLLNGWVVKHRNVVGWHQFQVPLIFNVRLTSTQVLRARPDYNAYDKSIAQVICRFENISACERD